jgi:hypothetical protein
MAEPVPAIHVFKQARKQDVDARHRAGHDEEYVAEIEGNSSFESNA